MENTSTPTFPMKNRRMMALDLLRGFDMLLLTVGGPLFTALNETWPLPKTVMRQFHHEWGGFTLWDIIMPMFIFACGAAVPFALGRRLREGRATLAYWRHVMLRFATLWVLGMMAQGRLLSLDLLRISFFNNTLQAIASGYLIAALALLIPSKRTRAALPIVLSLIYAVILHFGGDYSMDGNAAAKFETWFVSRISPAGSKVLELADPGYAWWLTVPMFGVMTLCGMESTEILLAEADGSRKAMRLAGLGAGLLAVGWALSPIVPPIKHIYTVSFTAQAMGWCALCYAMLYWIADVAEWRRGWWLVLLFGQVSLFAYVMRSVFRSVLTGFAETATSGFAHAFGERSLPLSKWFFASAFLVFLLHLRRASRSK